MICNFQLKVLQPGILQTNPNCLNAIENFLQPQSEMKEPGLWKCWRLNAEDEVMKMQLQPALRLANYTTYRYSHTCTDWYDTWQKITPGL